MRNNCRVYFKDIFIESNCDEPINHKHTSNCDEAEKKNVLVQFVMLYILFHPTTKATEVITWGDMSY